MRRNQSVGTDVSDGLDSTSMEPRIVITGAHLAQTHTAQTMTNNILI